MWNVLRRIELELPQRVSIHHEADRILVRHIRGRKRSCGGTVASGTRVIRTRRRSSARRGVRRREHSAARRALYLELIQFVAVRHADRRGGIECRAEYTAASRNALRIVELDDQDIRAD